MRLRMRHYKLNGKSDRHREVAVFLRLSLMGSLTFVQPLRHACGVPPLLVGEALAYRKASPLRQRLPLLGATATTAASGGSREELLGQRPAGCERQRSRRWEPQPGLVERSETERLYEGEPDRHARASPFGRGVCEADGEGKPVSREPPRSDKQALCQSDAIAALVHLRQRPCPLSLAPLASSPKGRAFSPPNLRERA